MCRYTRGTALFPEGSTTRTAEQQTTVVPDGEQGVLAQFIHELSSPLSLLCMHYETEPHKEKTVEVGVERLRQLLNYASATLIAKHLPLAQMTLHAPIDNAKQRLRKGGVCLGAMTAEIKDAVAALPAEPVWAEVLLGGWLEAACYGAPEAPISVRANSARDATVVLTAESGATLRRDVRLLRQRLAVRAASHLAHICGGRLIVHSSELKAILVLPKTPPAPDWE